MKKILALSIGSIFYSSVALSSPEPAPQLDYAMLANLLESTDISLTMVQVESALKTIGQEGDNKEVRNIFNKIDSNKDGVITKEELLILALKINLGGS